MKKIVITGAKGGAAASIVDVLQQRGCDVIGVDIKPWMPEDGTKYVQLDLRDMGGVNDVFAGADGVVHFGSPPADAWLSTTEAFHLLAVAGFNVFQAARNVGIKRIAWASSIEVYGDLRCHTSLPVIEESPLAPPGIYGGAKILLERLAMDYCRWYGMSIASFRLSRIIYNNESGRAKLRTLVANEQLGSDCLWSYIDARDVGTACLAWLRSDKEGAAVYNLAALNVHQDVDQNELINRYGYGHLASQLTFPPDQTLFCTDRIRTELDWDEAYNWRDILTD